MGDFEDTETAILGSAQKATLEVRRRRGRYNRFRCDLHTPINASHHHQKVAQALVIALGFHQWCCKRTTEKLRQVEVGFGG